MLLGLYLLFLVGGLMADEQYNVYAASGTTDETVPAAVEREQLFEEPARAEVVATSAEGSTGRAGAAAAAQPRLPPRR